MQDKTLSRSSSTGCGHVREPGTQQFRQDRTMSQSHSHSLHHCRREPSELVFPFAALHRWDVGFERGPDFTGKDKHPLCFDLPID